MSRQGNRNQRGYQNQYVYVQKNTEESTQQQTQTQHVQKVQPEYKEEDQQQRKPYNNNNNKKRYNKEDRDQYEQDYKDEQRGERDRPRRKPQNVKYPSEYSRQEKKPIKYDNEGRNDRDQDFQRDYNRKEVQDHKQNQTQGRYRNNNNINNQRDRPPKEKVIDKDYIRQRDASDDEEEKNPFDITKVGQKELTGALISLFKRNKVECPICFVRIHPEAKIWNCEQCYSPFHLGCIHKWIKNTNSTQNQIIYNWSCPKCNLLYQKEMPKYSCFCGQEENPEHNSYIVPHACGHKCNRKRGKYCPHPCPVECHPGPCPECNVKGIVINCYCGQSKKQISCSEDVQYFACQNLCNKKLSCGVHTCQKMCHPGQCSECLVVNNISCHCGKTNKEVLCGVQSLSCNNPCGRTKNCGNHACESKTCHAQCDPCHLTPDLVTKCPCGKFKISDLLDQPRTQCTDPVPSCGTPQQKILNCGHKVPTICGGQVPKCKQMILQKCRCESNEQMVECWVLTDNPYFICDKVCKKIKSCKIHKCQTECCPYKREEGQLQHQCFKECNKQLQCGNHKCGMYCHLGNCQPCPIMIQTPIKCPCGRTQKNPPNLCGTKPPECHQICGKPLQCTHLCQFECHKSDCPKCQIIVMKKCRCQKLETEIHCFKTYVCTNKCSTKLICGHICQDPCPVPQEICSAQLNGCNQRCGKKLFCGHPCSSQCHGSDPCPKEPCKTQVRVKCQCGNREAFVDCGVIDEPLEKHLTCNNICVNIKRFGSFYNSSSQMVDLKKTYYPSVLMKFTHYNLDYLRKLEQKLEEFLIKTDDESYAFSFGKTEWSELKKQSLQILLSRHYKFEVQFERMVKGGYLFTVRKDTDTTIPNPKLSEYYIKVQQGKIKRDQPAFEADLRTVSQLTAYDIEQIESQIKEFKSDYYIEKHQGYWSIQFWEYKHAEEVLKKIRRIVGYSQVVWNLNINNSVLDEQAKISIKSNEEIVVQRPKKYKIQYGERYSDSDELVEKNESDKEEKTKPEVQTQEEKEMQQEEQKQQEDQSESQEQVQNEEQK